MAVTQLARFQHSLGSIKTTVFYQQPVKDNEELRTLSHLTRGRVQTRDRERASADMNYLHVQYHVISTTPPITFLYDRKAAVHVFCMQAINERCIPHRQDGQDQRPREAPASLLAVQ